MITVKLYHPAEDFPVGRSIEVIFLQLFRCLEHRATVLEHGAQNAAFRLHAVGRRYTTQL